MHGEEDEFGANGFQMMGMINAMKTGDVHTDMFIAMCVPFILKMLFSWVGKLENIFDSQFWSKLFPSQQKLHERFISHKITRSQWGYSQNADEDSQNSILLKAIKLYLHEVVKLDLMRAYLNLTGMEDNHYDGYYDAYDSDDEDEENDYGSRKTLVGQLSRYKMINQLPMNEWHDLGNFGSPSGMVSLRIGNESTQEGNDNKNQGNNNTGINTSRSVDVTTFHFTSPEKGAIDDFINTAYRWYLDELKKMEDDSRYYYEMKIPEFKFKSTLPPSVAFGKGNDDHIHK